MFSCLERSSFSPKLTVKILIGWGASKARLWIFKHVNTKNLVHLVLVHYMADTTVHIFLVCLSEAP